MTSAPEHGTAACYRAGCSCQFCKAGNTALRHEKGYDPTPAPSPRATALIGAVRDCVPRGALWDVAPQRWAELVAACSEVWRQDRPLADVMTPARDLELTA